MAKSFVNKVKDVVTLKTFRENFFKNDGSIDQWIAHGSTEAANMVLHGQAAPVYAGNVSPPDSMSNEVAEPMQAFTPMQDQKTSFLSQKMLEIEQQPEMVKPEMEME